MRDAFAFSTPLGSGAGQRRQRGCTAPRRWAGGLVGRWAGGASTSGRPEDSDACGEAPIDPPRPRALLFFATEVKNTREHTPELHEALGRHGPLSSVQILCLLSDTQKAGFSESSRYAFGHHGRAMPRHHHLPRPEVACPAANHSEGAFRVGSRRSQDAPWFGGSLRSLGSTQRPGQGGGSWWRAGEAEAVLPYRGPGS